MKKMTNSLVLGSVLAASTFMSGVTMAGSSLTGNVGVVSEYIFRGINQINTATASGGVDYDFGNGMAIGTWGADVVDGLEVDLYGSYSGEINGISYSVGVTTYNYTGNSFDDNYKEINLSAGMGPVSVGYNKGSHKGAGGAAGIDEDYTFISLTFEQGNAYATYGKWDTDALASAGSALDGSYVELGYGMESGGFDVGVALIRADKDLSSGTFDSTGVNPAADTTLTFSLGKSFDL